jgi:hypothetical protein
MTDPLEAGGAQRDPARTKKKGHALRGLFRSREGGLSGRRDAYFHA